MWPVSDRYTDTWMHSHTQLVYVEVLVDGAVISSMLAGTINDPDTGLPVSTVGGSVTVSNTPIRRSGSIQLLDPSGQLLPLHTDDFLVPFRTELRIWMGFQYWDATLDPTLSLAPGNPGIEYVPVGTLVLVNPQISGHVLTAQGYDRAWLLDNFTAPYTIASGTTVPDAINNLLALGVPTKRLITDLPDSEYTVGSKTIFDADTAILDAVQKIARLAGWVVYVDPMGTFTVSTPNTTDADPDLYLSTGPFSTLIDTGRDIGGSNEVKNAVIMTNEGGTQTPVRGYAQDDNPDSLTYVNLIGVRPIFDSNPYISTQSQADNAARTELISRLGLVDAVTAAMVPIHALEVDDVLMLDNPNQSVTQLPVLVDNFSFGLRAGDGVMNVACRKNVIVS